MDAICVHFEKNVEAEYFGDDKFIQFVFTLLLTFP